MGKLKFSNNKFTNFIAGKGFYLLLAVGLIGAGAAAWTAVDRTIDGIEGQNNTLISSQLEAQRQDFTEEAGKHQENIPQPSKQQATSSQPSSSPEPSSNAESVSKEPEASPASQNSSYIFPVEGNVIQKFSNDKLVKNETLGDWRTHDGIDIAAAKGTHVLAAAAGEVIEVTDDPLWGWTVKIRHNDGLVTVYAGLARDLAVKVGDKVPARRLLGTVDQVPVEVKAEPHLHFAVQKDGVFLNPLSVLG